MQSSMKSLLERGRAAGGRVSRVECNEDDVCVREHVVERGERRLSALHVATLLRCHPSGCCQCRRRRRASY
jgi:hypothetical protein